MHPPPVVLFGAAALIQRMIARRRSGRDHIVSSPEEAKTTLRCPVVAVGTAAASLALIGAAGREFNRAQTTVDPLRVARASSLIESGPFRYSRNPIYLGMAGLLTAHAVGRRSMRALLPVAGFVVAINRLQIAVEEETLRQKFGRDYDEYTRRVPRWIGPRTK